MASYKIVWKQSAQKELKRLDKPVIARIISAIESLATEPRPDGSKKLRGAEHLYRVRVGEYRVVYSVMNEILLVEVIRVGHRKEIYRRLI